MNGKIPVILSLVIIALLIIFVVRPGVIGYTVYRDVAKSSYTLDEYGADVQELKFNLSTTSAELITCNLFNEKFLAQIEDYSYKYSECKTELSISKMDSDLFKKQCDTTTSDFQAELDLKKDELDDLKNERAVELADLKDDYGILAQNLADNLCCKHKVDNPNIDSYIVENNMVLCLEDGEFNITCHI
jgi:hypothetical protein